MNAEDASTCPFVKYAPINSRPIFTLYLPFCYPSLCHTARHRQPWNTYPRSSNTLSYRKKISANCVQFCTRFCIAWFSRKTNRFSKALHFMNAPQLSNQIHEWNSKNKRDRKIRTWDKKNTDWVRERNSLKDKSVAFHNRYSLNETYFYEQALCNRKKNL